MRTNIGILKAGFSLIVFTLIIIPSVMKVNDMPVDPPFKKVLWMIAIVEAVATIILSHVLGDRDIFGNSINQR